MCIRDRPPRPPFLRATPRGRKGQGPKGRGSKKHSEPTTHLEELARGLLKGQTQQIKTSLEPRPLRRCAASLDRLASPVRCLQRALALRAGRHAVVVLAGPSKRQLPKDGAAANQ
eukprot:5165132-Alexandrium_andersonii.AAC.1